VTREISISAEIAEIKRDLARHVEALVVELLPAGYREGREWRVGNFQGDPGDSLAVHLAGDKAGVWCDFADGARGDVFDLAACRT
jgi:twinkle protein